MTDDMTTATTDPIAASAPAAPRVTRGRRATSIAGQVLGILGFVISLVLVLGVVFGRGWLVGQVDEVSGRVDAGIARALPLVDRADARLADVTDRVGAVSDAAQAIADGPSATPEALQGLLARVNALSERYLALRSAYAGLREDAVSALERLQLLDRLVPAISVPQGPVDALATLDERAQALDAAVMPVVEAASAGRVVNETAQAIAGRTGEIESKLGSIQDGLDTIRGRLDALRADIAAFADSTAALVTVGTLAVVLLLLWVAFLHVVLYRSARRYGRAPGA